MARPPEAHAALAIVEAQYRRALARAVGDDSGDRAGAFAEARRLLRAAVALRHRLALQDPLDLRREVSRAPHRSTGADGTTGRPYDFVSV